VVDILGRKPLLVSGFSLMFIGNVMVMAAAFCDNDAMGGKNLS
jgi:hypothetical protein